MCSKATEGFQFGEVKGVSNNIGNGLFQALTGLGFFGFCFSFFSPLFFSFFCPFKKCWAMPPG